MAGPVFEPLRRVSENLRKKDEAAMAQPESAVKKPTMEDMVAQQKQEQEQENDRLAQVLIGLAPALLGAAIGGNEGGAIGGKVGMQGLADLERQKKEYKEEQKLKSKEQLVQGEKEFDKRLKIAGFNQKEEELGLKKKELAAKEKERELGGKPTSDQSKAALFAKRLEQANQDLARVEEAGFDRSSKAGVAQANIPGFLEGFKPQNAKLQDQAERNFVNAILRRESGAAISPGEFVSAESQYFPRAGDTPEVKAQKARNRELAIAGLQGEAGPRALSAIADIARPPPLKKEVKTGLPEVGVTEVLAADPNVVEYAKNHGLQVDQAATILYNRGYRGQ